jgi:basic membrane lipoprotein Med (substrate-binding protein (PBP1-ABC) superfamily)
MNQNRWGSVLSALALGAAAAVFSQPACAQATEIKEKPPMYTYVADWNIPRAQWGEMAKNNAADEKLMEKAFASGTIVGYGNDMSLIHQPDQSTHDGWWSAMSMAGVLNLLDQAYSSGSATTPVLSTATKHWDNLYVSRYYNWHSGSWKGVYTHGSTYTLKKDAPPDAVEQLTKNVIAPLMEKMLAEGAIHEWEVDTEAIHTANPNTFTLVYIAANAEGLDKVNAALAEMLKSNPLNGTAFTSMLDYSTHRDELMRTNATYK